MRYKVMVSRRNGSGAYVWVSRPKATREEADRSAEGVASGTVEGPWGAFDSRTDSASVVPELCSRCHKHPGEASEDESGSIRWICLPCEAFLLLSAPGFARFAGEALAPFGVSKVSIVTGPDPAKD